MPSGRPPDDSAVIAAYPCVVFSDTAVSNPVRRITPTGRRCLAEDPAWTCQCVTSVAPFQLTNRNDEPAFGPGLAATAGTSRGVPFHWTRSAR